ncbi:ABC transporter substrate-binding protein [Kineosporia sp. R_H_3]|uniref:ABC transporter substrate-binding protein n=1 Tax=Kineosporia sp. R_H_3 TaxID=1961848 RepID=UPI0013040F61|nr:ABC transporter substrate-binding protein [Kineosporia sp. R_H_3]
MPVRLLRTTWSVAALLLLGACSTGSTVPATSSASVPARWADVLAEAKGQTVNWYMWGGDEGLNRYVDGWVSREAAKVGVTVRQVKIADTVDAVNKILGERQAGRTSDGSVDLVWVNGENFATGRQADLWACGWPSRLPNARYVDLADPAIANDFGRPVEDCEAAWNTTTSALVYDSAKVSAADVGSLAAFEQWVRAHPGRFTYPAPPDFTGSMVVRTFAYDEAGGYQGLQGSFDQTRYDGLAPRLWSRLTALGPSLWRGGDTYPASQEAVAKLFADAEIDAYFTYGVGGLGTQVAQGRLPATTRSAVFSGGSIGNANFLAIPKNSPHQAAAMVLADLLQSPAAQYEKKVNPPGYDPAIDTTKAGDFAARFAAIPVPAAELPTTVLAEAAVPEMQASWVTRLEKDWVSEVQQR